MDKKEKTKFLKWYLREFFTTKINKNIWDETKKYSIKDNIIIYCSIDNINYIMSSLLRQYTNRVDFLSIRLSRILEVSFVDNVDDINNRLTHSRLLEPDILIIKEIMYTKHSWYKNILCNVINDRIINNKNTIIILTSINEKEILVDELVKKFKRLISNNIINNTKKFNIKKPIKNDVFNNINP